MSPEPIITDATGAEGYAVNAQYYDLIFPTAQRDALRSALTTLLVDVRRVVEIGSGTGQFTETLLANLPEDGEVYAIEPAAVMRAALTTRLAALDVPPVTVLPEDALRAEVDGNVDAVVLLNVLTHFSPADRRALWARWIPRLSPGGLVVVDVPMPQAAVAVPASTIPGRVLGRRRYDTVAEATVDGDGLLWTMTYRVHEGDRLVSEDAVSFPSFVVSEEMLNTELLGAGCEPVDGPPAGVLVWRKGEH
ncbi:class I SAM-dependent methyltransferase [Amycolatopsis decaplanina]|uniref:Type 12 methyltransferase n=1 Tax=Amycolatopsis decaplanina DSM 44594 TaxID=1284240 RepID=M2YGU2_9PSEU|nr:class I SAM-dependent methyltransferase [Amycolatopsis decaplanina]EME60940.1 type 12 methyltransferase [Amycolatopsis decaplanina DSM 44594]